MSSPWPVPICEICRHEIPNAKHIDRGICDKCKDKKKNEYNRKRNQEKRNEINANEKSA